MNRTVREYAEHHRLKGCRAVVVGAGSSGLAAARLLHAVGARVRLVDSNTDIAEERVKDVEKVAELQTGPHSREQFSDASIVVLSPGVPVRKLADFIQDVPPRRVVAELELASWFIEAPIVAVTGSNGKTTTTTLIGEILKSAGKKVFVGGNIGTPPSQYLLDMEPADVVVLEVSSFQLQNCRLFKPEVALLLNFAPNHLDWHVDMQEYLDAKLRIFAMQTEEDVAIVHESLKTDIRDRAFTRSRTIWYGDSTKFEAPHLPGDHNKANVQAAWLAAEALGVTREQAAKAIHEFHPLAHRLEKVAEVNGVTIVNDSKATTLEAVAAAVKSFEGRPVRLLMGGIFKGGDVAELAESMKGHVAQVGLFGASKDIFEPDLARLFPVTWDETIELAAKRLFAECRDGDVLLLSPGTSSFDQYPNYKARGDDFKRIAGELK